MKLSEKISESYLKELKNFDKDTTVWIIKNSRPQFGNIILLSVLYALLSFSGILMALFARGIVDSASYYHNITMIAVYGLLLLLLISGQLIIRIVAKITSFNINSKLEISIKSKLFSNILKKSYSDITAFHSGELLNRLTSDVTVITNTITSIIPNIVFFIVKLISVFIVLFSIDWKFTIVLFAGGIAVIIFMLIFKGTLKNYHKRAQETDGKVRGFMQESLANALVIKVFNAYKRIIGESDKLQYDNFLIKRKRNYISIASSASFALVFSMAYIYGLIWGSVAIFNELITYGVLTQILSLVSQIQTPVQGLTSVLPQYYQALASAERIIEIEKLEDEHSETENKFVDTSDIYKSLSAIEFNDISFAYDNEIVLENTNLSISKGDFAVITGISGIGKSTLIKLLLDVFPVDKGEIYFQLKNGKKIYVDKNVRKMFAYVPQGNLLLSGTIRDNITLVRSDATEEEISRAIEISCSDFIYDLPDGLETRIGEKGLGLSEGQVQRIAIARAVICQCPIILLDEATSALDSDTEMKLLQNIKNLDNKTCILISHKKAANEVCNKEIRIVNKKIIVKDI